MELLLTTYNRLEYLKVSLDQIFKQTMKIPINIWDNGSNGDVLAFLDSISPDKFNGGRIIKNMENFGTAKARNKGLTMMNKNLVMISDDDMWYDKNYFKNMFEAYNLARNHFKSRIAVIANYHPHEDCYYENKILEERVILGRFTIDVVTGLPPGNWLLDREIITSLGGFHLPKDKKMGFSAYHLTKKIHNFGFLFLRLSKINGKEYNGAQHMDNINHPLNKINLYKKTGYHAFREKQKGKDRYGKM